MKLTINIDIDRKMKPAPARAVAYALRGLEKDLEEGTGDIVDGIRLGMRARQRLFDAAGNTIGFADIDG